MDDFDDGRAQRFFDYLDEVEDEIGDDGIDGSDAFEIYDFDGDVDPDEDNFEDDEE